MTSWQGRQESEASLPLEQLDFQSADDLTTWLSSNI